MYNFTVISYLPFFQNIFDGNGVAHQVTKILEIEGQQHYLTKGDNNSKDDRQLGYIPQNGLLRTNIMGIVRYRLPKLGYFYNILRKYRL